MVIKMQEENNPYVTKEYETCNMVAIMILALGLASMIVYIVNFGETIDTSSYDSHKEWSLLQIGIGISIFINSAFFAFVVKKIGSILEKLEKLSLPIKD